MTFPFRGIVPRRPYPPTGLTTARWAAEVRPVEVALADLWLTQDGVNIAALFGHTIRDSDRYPHAVAWRGALYLEDGHNRTVRAALRERATHMTCRVFHPHHQPGGEVPQWPSTRALSPRPSLPGPGRPPARHPADTVPCPL